MKIFFTLLFLVNISVAAYSQQIIYSKLQPFSNWNVSPTFKIIGKINNNYWVYQYDKTHFIKQYNQNMELIKKRIKLPFITAERKVEVKYIAYQNYCFLVWQIYELDTITIKGIKINADGIVEGEVFTIAELNTGHDGDVAKATSFYYGVKWSEDKSKIALYNFKRNANDLSIEVKLYDNQFVLLEQNTIKIVDYDMDLDYFNNFTVTNKGDIIFARSNNREGLFVNSYQVLVKKKGASQLINMELAMETSNIVLPTIKVDNDNGYFLVNGLYSEANSVVVKGVLLAKFSLASRSTQPDYVKKINLSDAQLPLADFKFGYTNLILKNDGGMLLITETNNQHLLKYDDELAANNPVAANQKHMPKVNTPYTNVQPMQDADMIADIYAEDYFSNSTLSQKLNNGNAKIPFESIQSNFTIIALNKLGQINRDTSFSIVKNIKIKKQQLAFKYRFSTNFFTSFVSQKAAGFIAFAKNLNEQYVLNIYELSNKNNLLNIQSVKGKYEYYFFDVAAAKQVENDGLLMPFFRNNKIGFAKINF